MSKSFFDFGDTYLQEERQKKVEDFVKRSTDENIDIESMINKYSNMSQQDLMATFYEEVNKQKKNGTFNVKNLQEAVNNLSPYLNPTQMKNIKELLNKVK